MKEGERERERLVILDLVNANCMHVQLASYEQGCTVHCRARTLSPRFFPPLLPRSDLWNIERCWERESSFCLFLGLPTRCCCCFSLVCAYGAAETTRAPRSTIVFYKERMVLTRYDSFGFLSCFMQDIMVKYWLFAEIERHFENDVSTSFFDQVHCWLTISMHWISNIFGRD